MRLFSICLRAVGLRLYALSLAIRTLFRELGKSPLGQFPPIKWVPISCPTLTLDMGRIHWRGGGGEITRREFSGHHDLGCQGSFRSSHQIFYEKCFSYKSCKIHRKKPLLFFFIKILKNKKKKMAVPFFYCASQEIRLSDTRKHICIVQSNSTILFTRGNLKIFNISSKQYSSFSNMPPANWVAII